MILEIIIILPCRFFCRPVSPVLGRLSARPVRTSRDARAQPMRPCCPLFPAGNVLDPPSSLCAPPLHSAGFSCDDRAHALFAGVFSLSQLGMSKRLNMVKPQVAVHQEKIQDIKARVRHDTNDPPPPHTTPSFCGGFFVVHLVWKGDPPCLSFTIRRRRFCYDIAHPCTAVHIFLPNFLRPETFF